MMKREESSHLRSDRILNSNNTYCGQLSQNVVLVLPVGLWVSRKVAVGHADGSEPLAGHGFDYFLHHLVPVPRSEEAGFARLVQNARTPEADTFTLIRPYGCRDIHIPFITAISDFLRTFQSYFILSSLNYYVLTLKLIIRYNAHIVYIHAFIFTYI